MNLMKDPIWGEPAEIDKTIDDTNSICLVKSRRCGGCYRIEETLPLYKVRDSIRDLSDREKVKLTLWLAQQRQLGNECPTITLEIVDHIKQKSSLSESDRADEILKYIDLKTGKLGEGVLYASDEVNVEHEYLSVLSEEEYDSRQRNYYNLLIFSESIDYEELDFLLRYLEQCQWIRDNDVHDNDNKDEIVIKVGQESRHPTYTKSCYLTIEGYKRLAKIKEIKKDSLDGFMAMWFHNSMKESWNYGFKPGIKNAGYKAVRIDEEEHADKIDDKIIASIRRARFVVADLTHGKKGVRGSVYYEAGFAHGLGIPVIFTCREDYLKKVHFDIRQYNCISWKEDDLKKLQEDLTNRITAIIGDGPDRPLS